MLAVPKDLEDFACKNGNCHTTFYLIDDARCPYVSRRLRLQNRQLSRHLFRYNTSKFHVA